MLFLPFPVPLYVRPGPVAPGPDLFQVVPESQSGPGLPAQEQGRQEGEGEPGGEIESLDVREKTSFLERCLSIRFY